MVGLRGGCLFVVYREIGFGGGDGGDMAGLCSWLFQGPAQHVMGE